MTGQTWRTPGGLGNLARRAWGAGIPLCSIDVSTVSEESWTQNIAVRFARRQAQLPGRPLLVNMVHDELLVEVDGAHAPEVQQALVEEMLAAGRDLFPAVPMAVDARHAPHWEH